jgi:flagellar hook-associated protein 2
MPTSSLSGAVDSLLSSLMQGTLSIALEGKSAAALFLPREAFGDPTSQLATKDLISLLSGTRTSLLSLSSAAARLDLANPLSAFFSGTATSSNTAVVTGQVIGGVSLDTAPVKASYSFTVSQLAVTQANVGSALISTGTSTFSTGTNAFSVTQKGVTTSVSFSVAADDTNLTVLTNMAQAINSTAGLGVSASVSTDPQANTSRLIVTANDTGTANAFTLADVTATAVSDAGVGSATTSAANLAYTQNGVGLSSSSNDLYLGSNADVKVSFLATSASPVVLSVAPDTTQISSAIATLVDAYNAAKGFFESQPDVFPGIITQLHSAASRSAALLANIGVQSDAAGGLSIDTAKLSSALGQYMSSVQAAFGAVGGLAKELHSIADTQLSQPRVATNPLPPFSPGTVVQTLVGAFAGRLGRSHLTGLLVDSLL